MPLYVEDKIPTIAEMIAEEDRRIRTAVQHILATRIGSKGQLLGEVMKHLQGKANPALVLKIIEEELQP